MIILSVWRKIGKILYWVKKPMENLREQRDERLKPWVRTGHLKTG